MPLVNCLGITKYPTAIGDCCLKHPEIAFKIEEDLSNIYPKSKSKKVDLTTYAARKLLGLNKISNSHRRLLQG